MRDVTLLEIAVGCPKLELLNCNKCTKITDQGLYMHPKFHKLRLIIERPYLSTNLSDRYLVNVHVFIDIRTTSDDD